MRIARKYLILYTCYLIPLRNARLQKAGNLQEAVALVVQVYESSRKFPSEEKFGLISQLNRSSVSIASNIAEGAGRLTNGEFRQFLGIASGSCFECETQLIICERLGILPKEQFEQLSAKVSQIQRMIYKLIQSLK